MAVTERSGRLAVAYADAPISREVDGERVEGVTRPVFVCNGKNYFLTDLEIYADGSIWCREWVDLAGLKAKLTTGWIATSFEPGAWASVYHLGSWKFADSQLWIKPDWLVGEAAEAIGTLNGRPDPTGRCQLALEQYVRTRSEADQAALGTAYKASLCTFAGTLLATWMPRTGDRLVGRSGSYPALVETWDGRADSGPVFPLPDRSRRRATY